MQTRRLGRTGLDVGALGFHVSWRPRDADEGTVALRHALERGVDVVLCDPSFDRALEAIAGGAVRDLRLRDRALVVTRVLPEARGPALHPRGVTAQVEASLRATRLDAIPLVLVPWDDRHFYASWWPDARAALARLVREGKVLRWGIEPAPVGGGAAGAAHVELDACLLGLSEPSFEVVAAPVSLVARAGVAALAASAARHQVGVIATRPLGHGLLAGGWPRDTKFPPGDWRGDVWTPARLAADAATVDALRPLARAETDTLAELALRVALGVAGVASAAPAMRTRAQVDDNLRAADGRALGAPLRQRLAEALGDPHDALLTAEPPEAPRAEPPEAPR